MKFLADPLSTLSFHSLLYKGETRGIDLCNRLDSRSCKNCDKKKGLSLSD